MADYWKSNPRKFCDVCQCWMADNKISIQNHEGGMRHKANVEKKMNELQRSSINAEKEKQKFQESLQKINDSAYVGMMKDIARDPSLAKRYGVVLTEEQQLAHKRETETKSTKGSTEIHKQPVVQNASTWREATTPDGKKYFWNTITRETRWTPPEGESVAPETLTVKEEKNKLQQFVFNRLVELSESGSTEANAAVQQAFNAPSANSEKIDDQKVQSTKGKRTASPEQQDPPVFQGPKIDLLGQWVTVEDTPQKKLPKLDLPTSSAVASDVTEDADSRTAVLSRLEETTFADIHGASRLGTEEKQVAPGALTAGSASRNVPKVVFRKRGTDGNNPLIARNFRTTSTAD